MDRDVIAKAIYDWLSRPDGEPIPGYRFEDRLIVAVDGEIDCKELADVLIASLAK